MVSDWPWVSKESTSPRAGRENSGYFFRDVVVVGRVPSVQRTLVIARYLNAPRQPLHQVQWSVLA